MVIRSPECAREETEDFYRHFPGIYSEMVKKGVILEPATQMQLADMDETRFMDYLMERNTSMPLCIYPEYASRVMRDFSDEIFDALESLKRAGQEDLPKPRKKPGNMSSITALMDCGDLYTQVPRTGDDMMMTGEPEHRIEKATPVSGPRFFATTTGGYYGFLKFREEEIASIAPEGANAYLLGAVWCLDSVDGNVRSPIIEGYSRDTGLEKGTYHVAPVKFFSIETGNERKLGKTQ